MGVLCCDGVKAESLHACHVALLLIKQGLECSMISKCIPSTTSSFFLICLGYDVIAQAQSGTGKTATFAISILQQIELDLKATQALVLAPTRELAQQVRE